MTGLASGVTNHVVPTAATLTASSIGSGEHWRYATPCPFALQWHLSAAAPLCADAGLGAAVGSGTLAPCFPLAPWHQARQHAPINHTRPSLTTLPQPSLLPPSAAAVGALAGLAAKALEASSLAASLGLSASVIAATLPVRAGAYAVQVG